MSSYVVLVPYGHGKLDLKFVHVRAEKFCPKMVYKSESEIAEEKCITTSFR